jgi:hypothetical protein
MDWTTLAAAFVGGIFGGGLGSLVSYMQLRDSRRAGARTQQWQDAGLISDLWELLAAILPARRGINLSPDPAREREKFAALNEQQQQVSKDLRRLAAGHPSATVRDIAQPLSSAVERAAVATEWHVRAIQNPTGGDFEGALTRAEDAHSEAVRLAQDLERAIKDAGGG